MLIKYVIPDSRARAGALNELATSLAQGHQWEQAKAIWKETEAVIGTIQDSQERAMALKDLAANIAATNEQEHLLHLIQRSWWQVNTREEALRLFPLATEFISHKSEIGTAFCEAFIWVDTFLAG